MTELILITAAILVVAVLYSSVGHAGASAYLAVMALAGVAPATMRPTALVLNLLVGTIATIKFARAGYLSLSALWPFAIASIPMAYVGGATQIPVRGFRFLVGAVLVVAAMQLLSGWRGRGENGVAARRPGLPLALIAGAGIGLLAGLTGTGGGIFLSPLLLFAGWTGTRESGGVAAPFVLLNSAAGLTGNLPSLEVLPSEALLWAPAALVGGLIGSELGARRVAPLTFRRLLGAVLLLAGCKLMLLP